MGATEHSTEQRYGTLHVIAGLLTFLGSAAAIVGPIGILAGWFMMGGDSTALLIAAGGGIALALGLVMLVSGESIGVQLDTEANTRNAAMAAATMLTDLRELKDLLEQMEASTRRTATAVEALATTIHPK